MIGQTADMDWMRRCANHLGFIDGFDAKLEAVAESLRKQGYSPASAASWIAGWISFNSSSKTQAGKP